MGRRKYLSRSDESSRFWGYVDKNGPNGCWIWTKSLKPHGYGHFRVWEGESMKTYRSHRVAYLWEVGPIPDGHILHHECHNRACVNPTHLKSMPREEHIVSEHPEVIADYAQKRSERLNCQFGHPYERWGNVAQRRCRKCLREYGRIRFLKKMGKWTPEEQSKSWLT